MPDLNVHDLVIEIMTLLPFAVQKGLSLIGAVVILIAGVWLSGRSDRLVSRLLSRALHIDEMLKSFFSSLLRYLILTITVLAVLSQFGIQTTSLVAVLGAASLAVGLALQGTLSNMAAGVMLLVFRPFRIGQKVTVGGITGTVKALSLFWTELVSDDNVQIIVPNGSVWGQPLRNLSYYPTPSAAPVELHFKLADGVDLGRALAAVQHVADTTPQIAKTPAPTILFNLAADNALEIVLGFTPEAAADVPRLKSDVIRGVHDGLLVTPG